MELIRSCTCSKQGKCIVKTILLFGDSAVTPQIRIASGLPWLVGKMIDSQSLYIDIYRVILKYDLSQLPGRVAQSVGHLTRK